MTTIEEAFEKYWSSLADAPNDSPQVVASCKWAAYHAWHAAIEQYTAERVAQMQAEFDRTCRDLQDYAGRMTAERDALQAKLEAVEPVAWIHSSYLRDRTYEYRVAPIKIAPELVPLYAAQPRCDPLTDDQIDAAIQVEIDPVATYRRLHNFARAIERAHGIGEQQNG